MKDELKSQWVDIIKNIEENNIEEKLNMTIDDLFHIFIKNDINTNHLKRVSIEYIKFSLKDDYKWINKDKFNQLLELPETTFLRYLIKSIIKNSNDETLVDYPLECLLQLTDITDKQDIKKIVISMLEYYEKDLDYFENVLIKL